MATICLAAAVMLLVGTPTLLRGSAYDRPIQDTLTQATDHRQALLASGVSQEAIDEHHEHCLLYTSPSPRDQRGSRMPSSA